MKKSYRLIIVWILLTVSVVGILYTVSRDKKEQNVCLNDREYIDYGTDWIYMDESGIEQKIDAPCKIKEAEGKSFVIRKRLDANLIQYSCLAVRSVHTRIVVYIEGEVEPVYVYGNLSDSLFPLPGCAWNMIELKPGYEGREIRIEFTSTIDKYIGSINKIYIGEKNSILLKILEDNIPGIICCFILLALSIVLAAIFIVTYKEFHNISLLHLAVFALLVFIWSMTETKLLQFLFGNMKVISVLTYEMLILLPMPLLAYFIGSSQQKVGKVSEISIYVLTIHFFAVNILQLTGILDLAETLVVTHALLALTMLSLLWVKGISMIKESRSGEKITFDISGVGLLTLGICLLFDIYRYYCSVYVDSAMFSRIGMIVYIICLGASSLQNGMRILALGKKAEAYEYLAYHDMMTGLFNRTAYSEKLEEINKEPEMLKQTMILNIDINNLKERNDNRGHEEGDKYIMENVALFKKFFEDVGLCYRIGGDEFCIIITPLDSELFFERLDSMVEELEGKATQADFSYGFAKFDSFKDNNILDTVRRADEKMYEYKRAYKESLL